MNMPKEFYEITKRGHESSDRFEKVRAAKELEEMLRTNDFGTYKKKAIIDEIHDLKHESNRILVERIMDRQVFHPRYIRRIMNTCDLEDKLIEEMVITNNNTNLIRFLLEHAGESFIPELIKENIKRVERRDGSMVLVDFYGNEVK